MSDTLPSWRDTPTRQAIVEFVESVTQEDSADYLPPPERVAVFDNDGWTVVSIKNDWATVFADTGG